MGYLDQKQVIGFLIVILALAELFIDADIYILLLISTLIICVVLSQKIVLKSHVDLWVFGIIIILGSIMSIYTEKSVSWYIIFRGIQYCTIAPLAICVGVYVQRYFGDTEFLFQKFMVIGYIAFILEVGKLIYIGDFSFQSLRENRLGMSVIYLACVFLTSVIDKEYIISKKKNIIALLLTLFLGLIGFSRANFIVFAIAIITLLIYKIKNKKYVLYVVGIIGLLTVGALFVINYASNHADTLLGMFYTKLVRGLIEVDSNQSFSSIGDISANWRGFEVYSAINQFNNADLIQKIFGQGFGGVYVGTYSSFVTGTEDYLPLLHNGYLSVLTYSGLVGISIFVLFYIKKIVTVFKIGKLGKEEIIFLICIFSSIITTFFVNGMISKSGNFILYLYIGFMCSKQHRINELNISDDR